MIRKFFLLFFSFGIFLSSSKAAVTLTGQVLHFNAFLFSFTIQSDSNFYVVNTNPNGAYSIDLSNVPNLTISCYFTDCNNHLVDTVINLLPGTNTWNPDYCPDSVVSVGSCVVSFTSTYCVCDNVFFLEVDTSQIQGATNIGWDFGDGNNSSELFTTHAFDQSALYNVCLHITMPNGDTCSYCHELGFDANGNLITKLDDNGFKIESIRKGTLDQHAIQGASFAVISNPASDDVILSMYAGEPSTVQMNVSNLLGETVKDMKVQAIAGQNYFKMNFAGLSQGIYILTARFGSSVLSEKIFKAQ